MKRNAHFPLAALVATTALLLGASSCNSEPGPKEPGSSKWISRVVEYRPAPGQFINTAQGKPEAAQKIVGGRDGCLSLGGFGGYVVFEFDHEVRNIPGPDFVIFGNAFSGSSEPGIVEVSPDGKSWYRLRGSEDEADRAIRDYTIEYTRPADLSAASPIAWHDSRNATGTIDPVAFHRQSYWPVFLADQPHTLTFSGICLPANASWDDQAKKYVLTAFQWGYADNWSADYDTSVGNDPDTRGSNKFDLDQAVDAEGCPVTLTIVRQIKVYTAQNQTVGSGLGETSTEICGALSLSAH